MTRLLASMALAWLALLAGAPAASAMTIEKITSPSGIPAWLVREQTVPLVTLNYAFHGGASQDGMPEGLVILSMFIAEARGALASSASQASAMDVNSRVMNASPPAGSHL